MKANSLNLFQRINLVMKSVDSVHKGSTVEMGNGRSYTAVTHDDVTALLHGPLTSAGIVAMPDMADFSLEAIESKSEYQGKVTTKISYLAKIQASVTFINIDDPAEKITTKCFSYAMDSSDKAMGKAYSMALKYCYLKTFMLESLDEEESRDYERPYKPSYNNGTTSELATPAQIGAIKKLYPMSYLEKLDPNTITKKQAGELISNAPKNKG
jgi:hypothetical protein